MGDNNKFLYYWILFLIVFLFSWWSNPSLEGRIYEDTYDYIHLAEDLSHPSNSLRPFVYPLLIRGAMNVSQDNWSKLIVVMQMLFHAVSIILIFNMLRRYSDSVFLIFFLALAIGINPNLVFYTSALVPTQLFGCYIVINLYLFLTFLDKYKNTNNVWNIYFFVFGLFSAFTVALRSMYIFGIVPFIISIVFFDHWKKINIIPITVLILLHLSVTTIWNGYKNELEQEFLHGEKGFHPIKNTVLKTGGSWVNMAAIRGGLVDSGKGTKLYRALEEKKILTRARNCTSGDNTEQFQYIYNKLTYHEKCDREFSKKVLKSHPFKIILIQLSNWHEFFIKRMFYPNSENSFPGMSNFIRYVYVGSYNNLYRPIMPLLLLLFLFLLITKTMYNPLSLTVFLLVLLFSLGIAIMSWHPGLFIYYRTAIEYVLFICVLLPVTHIYNLSFSKFQ